MSASPFLPATPATAGRSWAVFLIRFLVLLALATLLAVQFSRLHGWEGRDFIDSIHVTLQPASSRVLGKHDLAAPAAAAQHVKVVRDDHGWTIFNVAESRRLALRDEDGWQHLRTLELASGMVIRAGHNAVTVAAVSPVLTLQGEFGVVHYDGAQQTGANASIHCLDDSWVLRARATLRRAWNAVLPTWQVSQSLSLGGLVSCANRLALDGLPAGAMHVDRNHAGAWVLRASAISARDVCMTDHRQICDAAHSLFMQGRSLKGGETLVVGRSHYRVQLPSSHADTLILQGLSRAGWLDQTPPLYGADWLAWQAGRYQLWAYPDAWPSPMLAASGLTLLLALAAAVLQWQRPGLSSLNALSMPIGVLLLVLPALVQGTHHIQLGLGWSWLLLCLAAVGWGMLKTPSVWSALVHAAAALLSFVGLWLQLELGLLGADTGGLRYWHGAAVGVSIFAGLLLLAQNWRAIRRQSPQAHDAWGLDVIRLAILALAAVVLQAVAGSEGGVFGFQPVELAKLALVLLAARVAAQWACFPGKRAAVWLLHLQGLLLVLVYVSLITSALLLVRDFSPLVLIAFWAVGFVLAASASAQTRSFSVLFFGALLLILPIAYFFQPQVFDLLHTQGIYGDRLDVWLTPHLHPHSGDQYLRGQALMSDADWRAAWGVPAIHDDFILAFVVARGGLALLALVLGLQAVLVLGLVLLAVQHLVQAQQASLGAARLHGRFIAIALVGGAAILLGHLVISAGTNFGFLPVMGQPMWGVSAGNSIRLLFVAPLIWLALQGVTPSKVNVSPQVEPTP